MESPKTLHSEIKLVEQLFRKYYPFLKSYAYRFLRDGDMAENIVQDVFLDIWRLREDLIFQKDIKSYLFKSVYHKCLNHLNSHLVRMQTSLDGLSEEDKMQSYFTSSDINQERLLFIEELRSEVEAIINDLPEQTKIIFLLSREQHLMNKDIADRLNISIKTVEKHMTKAFSVLRTRLKVKDMLFLLSLIYIN